MLKIALKYIALITLTLFLSYGVAKGVEKYLLNVSLAVDIIKIGIIIMAGLMIFMFRDMIFVGAKQHRDKGLIIPKLFLQAGTILSGVWVITGMLPLLIEIDKTNLLASLGAVTAIILLVFKDYIQGFVSGVYLLSEKLISQNDVITLPSQGLSGKIVEIGMRAIKLENEDKNIIIVPTYELSRSNFIKVSPENQIQ